MWCRFKLVLVIYLINFQSCYGDDLGARNETELLQAEVRLMHSHLKALITKHASEINNLKTEIDILRQELSQIPSGNQNRNEQLTLKWAQTALQELRIEMHEIGTVVNSSEWLKQQQILRNQIQMVLAETAGLAKQIEMESGRLDEQSATITDIRFELHQLRNIATEVQKACNKMKKELKQSQIQWKVNLKNIVQKAKLQEGIIESSDVEEENDAPAEIKRAHKIRHMHNMHKELADMAKSQDKLEESQQMLQFQILEIQNKLFKFDDMPDYNLLSEKFDILSQEYKIQQQETQNITNQATNFDKLHSSMLELLENVETIEAKVDKTVPDFQKEIAKLDLNMAQVNSQNAYLKEDQENIRQSVKAIAVSVSNIMDKSEHDHKTLSEINTTVNHLQHISKQHFYRLNDHILKSESNAYEINETIYSELPALIDEVKDLQGPHKEYEDLVSHLPHDCSSVNEPTGEYLIAPGFGTPIATWCEDKTTLIQQRYNGSVEFNRKYKDYETSFGSPGGEFWIGNLALSRLTADNCSSLRVDMTDIYGKSWFAEYEQILVGPPETGYTLQVSGYSGNASDAFEFHNRMEFSAIDLDRDISNTHCAGNYEGGWWFSHCQHVNLNGKYRLGLTWFDSSRNEWIAVAASKLVLFRRPGCSIF